MGEWLMDGFDVFGIHLQNWMPWIGADIRETVRLTREMIDDSRRAMADVDRALARQARSRLAKLFIIPR